MTHFWLIFLGVLGVIFLAFIYQAIKQAKEMGKKKKKLREAIKLVRGYCLAKADAFQKRADEPEAAHYLGEIAGEYRGLSNELGGLHIDVAFLYPEDRTGAVN